MTDLSGSQTSHPCDAQLQFSVKVGEFKRWRNYGRSGAASKSDAPKEHNDKLRHPTTEELEQATAIIQGYHRSGKKKKFQGQGKVREI